ncbi:MAG: hypothetical protein WA628_13405 [Terriglobales bacterium]
MRLYQHLFLWSVIAASFVPHACDHRGRKLTLRDVSQGEKAPKVIAAFQPWFGDPDHIRIEYNSNDPAVIRRQIREAKKLGIYAFAVDWYGARHPFLDRSYALIQQLASKENFHVALMYDETEEDDGHATEDALEALATAYKAYIGPDAPGRQAYLEYQGRPVIFVFPKRGKTDWNQVRQMVNRWENPPILLYKDDPPPQFANSFDGEYAWVHPGPKGWASDGSDWGEEYLQSFYKRMRSKRRDQITVGTVWPGFDDTRASWSLNRHIDQRCGKTLQDTLRVFDENNDPDDPMPFVLIATWNDYEEGTAIESGLARCSSSPTPSS